MDDTGRCEWQALSSSSTNATAARNPAATRVPGAPFCRRARFCKAALTDQSKEAEWDRLHGHKEPPREGNPWAETLR